MQKIRPSHQLVRILGASEVYFNDCSKMGKQWPLLVEVHKHYADLRVNHASDKKVILTKNSYFFETEKLFFINFSVTSLLI